MRQECTNNDSTEVPYSCFGDSRVGPGAAFPARQIRPAGIRSIFMRAAILRAAQWLSRGSADPDVARRLHEADQEIELAIHEIDRASVVDHKDMQDHPRIDARLDRNGRFRRMMELLQKSRVDIGREEDNPNSVGWRDLAYRHIDKAMEFVHHAARDLRIDRDLGW